MQGPVIDIALHNHDLGHSWVRRYDRELVAMPSKVSNLSSMNLMPINLSIKAPAMVSHVLNIREFPALLPILAGIHELLPCVIATNMDRAGVRLVVLGMEVVHACARVGLLLVIVILGAIDRDMRVAAHWPASAWPPSHTCWTRWSGVDLPMVPLVVIGSERQILGPVLDLAIAHEPIVVIMIRVRVRLGAVFLLTSGLEILLVFVIELGVAVLLARVMVIVLVVGEGVGVVFVAFEDYGAVFGTLWSVGWVEGLRDVLAVDGARDMVVRVAALVGREVVDACFMSAYDLDCTLLRHLCA